MNQQSQWLFETPSVLESTQANHESYSHLKGGTGRTNQMQSAAVRQRIPTHPPRPKLSPIAMRARHSQAAVARRRFVQSPAVREGVQEYSAPPKRYFVWDAWWLNPNTNRYELLEQTRPIYTVRADGESIRMTLLLKWQAQRGGTILARCFVWTGSQWSSCKDYSF